MYFEKITIEMSSCMSNWQYLQVNIGSGKDLLQSYYHEPILMYRQWQN